jgi:2,3-bisphosphoglycerate-independent phosphoglycerate mutase
MGNSEVGHINIGAGRVVKQELMRITDAVEDASLLENPALVQLCSEVRDRNSKLHLIGLCSDGGVHSHVNHLFGLLNLAKAENISDVCIHAIADGRDTKPKSGVKYIEQIDRAIAEIGVGKIVSISGRYYAMDRDHRWDRVKRAYDVLTTNEVDKDISAVEAIEASYEQDITDEFINPIRIAEGAVEPGDGIIFYNFRPDRARQLCSAFIDPNFDGFEREQIQPLSFVTFTQYDPQLPVMVAFEPQNLNNILGQVIADHGLRQLRTAETEKYAHVTYFFNGGLEEPFEGEDRELIPSPMVPTYDQQPEMSAQALTDTAIAALAKDIYSFVAINYANPDMVGHTGMLDAAVKAVETVDCCLGQLIDAIGKAGGTALITADHGNAELMWDENHQPWTAHTTNPVPLILIEGEGVKIFGHGNEVKLRENGCLADLAPTILDIMQLPQPPEMTGHSLIEPVEIKILPQREPVSLPV